MMQSKKKMAQFAKCREWFHHDCQNIPNFFFLHRSMYDIISLVYMDVGAKFKLWGGGGGGVFKPHPFLHCFREYLSVINK